MRQADFNNFGAQGAISFDGFFNGGFNLGLDAVNKIFARHADAQSCDSVVNLVLVIRHGLI
ncbi:MAG: hypothetical protein ACD_34C00073G0001, partial [uncultured bacterium]